MPDFPISQKVSFGQVCPVPQGWQCQGGDEQSVASFQLVRCRWHFRKARDSIYFPKYTQSSQNMQESVCSCITNPRLSHISRDHTAETRKALPLQTGARRGAGALLCQCRCLCGSGAPLGFMHTHSHASQLRWKMNCLHGKNIFNLALVLLQYGNLLYTFAALNSQVLFLAQLLWSKLTPAISQGGCTNAEGWEFSYSSWAETNHFQAICSASISYLAPQQSGVTSKAATYFIFSPDIWQKELIFQAHEENQLKNPSDCFSLVCRHLVPINVTVSHAHVSKRNTPLVHFVMSQHLELCHRFYSHRLSSPVAQGFFLLFFF